MAELLTQEFIFAAITVIKGLLILAVPLSLIWVGYACVTLLKELK